MRRWFRGKRGGAALFLAVAGLVAGGLGWVTADALRLEREQHQARADAELSNKLRLARRSRSTSRPSRRGSSRSSSTRSMPGRTASASPLTPSAASLTS